jgi:hypothetical protein
MNQVNPTTKRFARTLAEAFGPHTSTRVQSPSSARPRGFKRAPRITAYGVLVALVAVPTLYLAGRLLIIIIRTTAR